MIPALRGAQFPDLAVSTSVTADNATVLAGELRLMIYPLVLGCGRRLFGEGSHAKALRLVQTKSVGERLALLTYQQARS
jgi:hypothetical protein